MQKESSLFLFKKPTRTSNGGCTGILNFQGFLISDTPVPYTCTCMLICIIFYLTDLICIQFDCALSLSRSLSAPSS